MRYGMRDGLRACKCQHDNLSQFRVSLLHDLSWLEIDRRPPPVTVGKNARGTRRASNMGLFAGACDGKPI